MMNKLKLKQALKRFSQRETVIVSPDSVKDTAFVHYLETY